MDGASGNVAAVSGAVGLGVSGHGEGEFAGQDDVRGFLVVRVVGIVGVWCVLPHVGVGEAFFAQFFG